MTRLLLIVAILVSSPLLWARTQCLKALNKDLARLGMGTYYKPKGLRTSPEGMVPGVVSTFEQLLTLEAELKKEKKKNRNIPPRRYIASTSSLEMAVENTKAKFEEADIVLLTMGETYEETQDITWNGRRARIYLEGERVKAYTTDIAGDPAIIRIDPDCHLHSIHVLGPKNDRRPYLSFNARACGVLSRVESVAPMLTMTSRGYSEVDLCDSVGGSLDVRGDCRCKRQRSKTIIPPHEVCNESELRRQARRAIQIFEAVGNKFRENETLLDREDYLRIERACRLYGEFLPDVVEEKKRKAAQSELGIYNN